MIAEAPSGDLVPGVMTEYMTDDWGMFVRSAGTLARFRSAYQDVEVHDSVPFGKLFRLDGHFMTSERDEFFYHENMIHVPALAHPRPERALIVGGGDGGSAEELLKYPSMRSVTIAEIDKTVIDISREHLQAVHRGALDDPRVTIVQDDVCDVIARERELDAILLDVDNGPEWASFRSNARLYDARGLAAAHRALASGGIYAVWSGYPADAFVGRLERAQFRASTVLLKERGKVQARAYIGKKY